MDSLPTRLPRRALAELACLGEPFDQALSIRRKQPQVVRFERPLGGRADEVTELDGGIARVYRRLFDRLTEKCLGMLNVILVERVVAGDEHDHRLAVSPPPNAAGLLPEAHVAAGVACQDRHVERTHVDAQLERISRDDATQLPAAQPGLDLGAVVGAVPSFVCTDPSA